MSTNNMEEEQKVQYYTSLVNAWLTTKLEKDKHLLALSAGGIGLLVSLLTTRGSLSAYSLFLYFLGILCFIICLISIITIFNRNADHLEEVINMQSNTDLLLQKLDKVAHISFILGIVISFLIGISAGVDKLHNKLEVIMSDKKSKEVNIPITKDAKKSGQRSFDGIANLKPKPQTDSNNQNSSTASQQESSTSESDSQD